MLVMLDRAKCSSCADCVLTAPEVFDLDDGDALVVLLEDRPEARLHDRVRQAAKECPTGAITIDE